jgi:hypothetical protein
LLPEFQQTDDCASDDANDQDGQRLGQQEHTEIKVKIDANGQDLLKSIHFQSIV